MSSPRAAVLLGLVLFLSSFSGPGLAATTERVSVSSSGAQADGATDGAASVSADGRYVAFFMWAPNLVEDDTNSAWDVFVRDRQTETTERVSVSSDGDQGNGYSLSASISADGRYVAFESDAPNLVSGDINGVRDVFLHDRQLATTERVNVSTAGDEATGGSGGPRISADGLYVVFRSEAINLVSPDTNALEDLFVRDLDAGTTERVNVSTAGVQANNETHDSAISGDGRYVAFASSAANLVDNDTNGYPDIFVRDREAGTTERVSVSSAGDQATGASFQCVISADGRFVAFGSDAGNLVPDDTNDTGDVFVRDRLAGTTERVSVSTEGAEGDNSSSYVSISLDGRFVAFESSASTLVPDDTNAQSDIFVHDREAGITTRASLTSTGAQSFGEQRDPAISGDGRFVSFASFASDLVPDDTNAQMDVFLRDRQTFSDVPIAHWAFYSLGACAESGIIAGYDDGLYRPDTEVSRDQMAVYIARAQGWVNIDDPMDTAPEIFPDIPAGFWAGAAVQACVDNNVVQGYEYPDPDTPGETISLYEPAWTVTRDQMAVFVARSICDPTGDEGLVGYIPADPRNFPDVPNTGYGDGGTDPYWAYRYIEYCVEHGVVNGYDDGYYHPDWPVTRDQMAVYIARAFELPT